ncbi:leucine-rich repeat and IQ domain-containing protein 1 isoform X2 [Syngnathoides biaculeatus]|uniref:leucine-rich repeat and IQ domain-containing protein 1 isoform X2 n=1 Tax=Syngnathoides biaculeatus TaxID=300417 RepID=UPI002ADD55D9|nr:leucine-rich repeat and IQ domain-containing protein 1 isoform X2 [Syngnathoides biaculeatus]
MEEDKERRKETEGKVTEDEKKKSQEKDGRRKKEEVEIRSQEIDKGEKREKGALKKAEEEEMRRKEADRKWKEEMKKRNRDEESTGTAEEKDWWKEEKVEVATEESENRKKNEEEQRSEALRRKEKRTKSDDEGVRKVKEGKKKEIEVRKKTDNDEKTIEDGEMTRRRKEEERRTQQREEERSEEVKEDEEPLMKKMNKRDGRRVTRTEMDQNIHENLNRNIQENMCLNTTENIQEKIHRSIDENIPENLQHELREDFSENICENIHENIHQNIVQNKHAINDDNYDSSHENIQENIRQKSSSHSDTLLHSQLTRERGLSWMKGHVCRSEVQNRSALLRRRSVSSRREGRRSAQDDDLPPLCPDTLLRSAGRRSLQEVTILVLEDLPGCSLSTLTQCARLQSLTLRRCGLKVLEGINQLAELIYIDVQENIISRVDCENMTGLRVLKMGCNKLTSIHGLMGAENLDVLQLSHNSITRIAGLGSLRRLQCLSLDHNRLVSAKGLRDVCTLLHLNCSHNHLAGVEGLESNILLRTLDLTSNSLTEPPALHDHVLLGELRLDDNSLASLHPLLATSWLPHLRTLTVAHNRLTHLPDLSAVVSLTNLDLRFNCLSDVNNLCHSLEGCQSLKEVHLTGNPLQRESSWRFTLQVAVSCIRTIDGTDADILRTDTAVTRQTGLSSNGFLSLIGMQLEEIAVLQQQHSEQLSEASHSLDRIKLTCRHSMEALGLAEEQRRALERAHVGPKSDCRTTLEETLVEVLSVNSDGGNATPLCDVQVPAVMGTSNSEQMASHHQDKDLKRPSVTCEDAEGKAADGGKSESALTRTDPAQHHAATVIQARWRGFTLRRKLAAALAAVTSLQGDDENFEVVDVEEFVLDEAMLEQGWTFCEDSPTGWPSVSKQPLLQQSPGFYPEYSQLVLPPLPTRRLTQAWEIKEHEDKRVFQQSSNRSESASTSVASDFSERSERILEEWGFTNRQTAELMLRRAQKMKSKRKSPGPSGHLEAWRNQPLITFQLEAPNRLARRSISATRVDQVEAGPGRARWEQTQKWLQNYKTVKRSESDAVCGGRRRQRVPGAERAEHRTNGVWACIGLPAQGSNRNAQGFPKQDAPTPQETERISFRGEPLRRSGGWGGGKKRDKVKR